MSCCKLCKEERVVLLRQWIRLGNEYVHWLICVPCELKGRAE